MKITILDELEYEIEADSWKLSRCRDPTRPSEMDIVVSRHTPVRDHILLEASEGGKIWFRGYIFKQDIKNKTQKTLKCYGVEDLLFRRRCPRYGMTRSFANFSMSYADTWKAISSLLLDDSPSLDGFGPRLGLLYLCNSAVPDGLIEHYDDDNWTFKVSGFGTRFSTEETLTFYGRTLVKQDTLAECQATADSYYRDYDDLYIHPDATDFPDATRGILCMENAFDTTLRLGNYDADLDSESVHMVNFQVDGETYGDLIKSIADWHGLDVAYRYEPDGFTYIDLLEEPGRESTTGIATIREDEIVDIQTKSPSEFKPQVLFGLGYGGQDARQRYTRVDTEAIGLWLHGEYEYENGFVDANNPFSSLVDMEWARLANISKVYEIETLRPYQANPYDYIDLRLDGDEPHILPIEKIEYDSKGAFSLSLGNRDVDILDQFNERGSDQCYAKDIIRDGDNIWSTSGEISVTSGSFLASDGSITDWGTPGEVEIGCSASYVSGATRVILEISSEEDLYWNWVTLLKVTCDDVANDNSILRFYKTLDSADGIDITDICPPGSTRTFKFYLVYTAPMIYPPNPVIINYTIKYIITDDSNAWTAPENTILIYDGGVISRSPNYSPYFAHAYYNFDGELGRPELLDATGMTKANGTLVIDLMLVSGVASDLVSGFISISSHVGYTKSPPGANEWRIDLAEILPLLTTEAQTFEIPLSGAVTVGGECDVSNIHYFAFCAYGNKQIEIEWKRAYFSFPVE